MGISIAEMLGMDLPDDSDEVQDEVPEESQAASSSTEEAEGDPVEAAVVSALLAETNVQAQDFRPELTLEGDFDLDKIGRYAVVASIEQDLSITLVDETVDGLETLDDLMKAAQQASRNK